MHIREDIALFGKYAAEKVGVLSGRIEVTSACYQQCRLCDSWRDHRSGKVQGSWKLEDIKELVSQALTFPNFQFLGLTGGDPQAWPEFHPFLEWIIFVKSQLRERKLLVQLDTALQKKPYMGLWRGAVDRVRVSLDAVDPEIYKIMRGCGSPAAVLNHMQEFSGVEYSTITTVCEENLAEIPTIINELESMARKGFNLRKAMFMAAIDHRKSVQDEKFWQVWRRYEKIETSFPTSFVGESVREVREFCSSVEAKKIRCWVPNISFYAKADGTFYPCCLVGGEAVQTHQDFCIGDFNKDHSLRKIWEEYTALPFYMAKPLCQELCQYKQACLNCAAEMAAETILTMP